MPDPFTVIAEADEAIQSMMGDVLELRAAELQQRAMLDDYLADLPLRAGSRVLEVGCGTGAVARVLASLPAVAEVVGVDPSPVFVDRARLLAPEIEFVVGDGRELAFADASFDAVVCHTTLCHVPSPERVLAEAWRVTAPGGWLAVFDNDPTLASVAIGDHDPLQECVEAMIDAYCHDRWLIRRVPSLARAAGYDVLRTRSHSYVDTGGAGYLMTVVDRGADVLAAGGALGPEAAQALKDEARRRAQTGTMYAHAGYASVIARRP